MSAAVTDARVDAEGASRTSPGKAPAAVWVLTAAYALVVALWAMLTPQLWAPDEGEHFASVVRLSQGLEWPDPGDARFPGAVERIIGETQIPHEERSTLAQLHEMSPQPSDRLDQMTQHPPLYYLLASLVLRIPGVDGLVWDQALLLVRLLGAVMGAPLIWLAWSTIGNLLRSRRAGVIAATSVFLAPGLAQTIGVVTNDSLAILAAWVVTWLSVKVLTGDRRMRILVWAGVALGLGGLVKATVVPLAVLVVLVIVFGRGRAARWPDRLVQTLPTLGVAFVAGLWWWPRNLLLFGSLQPNGLLLDFPEWAPGARPSVGHFIDSVWALTPGTFWGWFGRVAVPMPELVIDVLTVGCTLLVVLGAFASRRWMRESLILTAPVVITALLFVQSAWKAYAETSVVRGLHGRYFYTVLLIAIALVAIAMVNLTRGYAHRVSVAVAIAATSVVMAGVGLLVAFLGFYAGDSYGSWADGVRRWFGFNLPVPGGIAVATGVSCVLLAVVGLVLAVRIVVRPTPVQAPDADGAIAAQ